MYGNVVFSVLLWEKINLKKNCLYFREECLSHGGGKPSHRLVSDFLGSEVRPEDLSDALIAEIDAKNDEVRFTSKSQL